MTEQTEKRARGTLVEALSSALERGGSGLANAPELLRRLLADESWRSFVTQRGELVEYDHFAEFIVTPPLKGLGTTVALVRRVVSDVPVFSPPDLGLLFTLPGETWYRAMVNVAGTLNLDWAIATIMREHAQDPDRFAIIEEMIAEVRRTKPLRSHFTLTEGVASVGSLGLVARARPAIARRLEFQTTA